MTAALAALRALGYEVTAEHDALHLRYLGTGAPPAARVRPLLTALRAEKPAVLALLRLEAVSATADVSDVVDIVDARPEQLDSESMSGVAGCAPCPRCQQATDHDGACWPCNG